jgi:hypothetical protein
VLEVLRKQIANELSGAPDDEGRSVVVPGNDFVDGGVINVSNPRFRLCLGFLELSIQSSAGELSTRNRRQTDLIKESSELGMLQAGKRDRPKTQTPNWLENRERNHSASY